jgi:DNA-binding CsgD family transcriptional regulator
MAKLDTRSGHRHADETRLATNLNQTPSQGLSDPEAQILLLIAAGKQTTDIAAGLGTDQAAVKEHIKSILRKAISSSGQLRRPKPTDLHSSVLQTPEMLSPLTA